MDVGTAKMLGLPIRPSSDGDCGTYVVPGTGQTNCYAGMVEGVVKMRLGRNIAFGIRGLKLIHHPHPLLLIGGDVMSAGRRPGINYAGMSVTTHDDGRVEGTIQF